jgi:hypothetical protein
MMGLYDEYPGGKLDPSVGDPYFLGTDATCGSPCTFETYQTTSIMGSLDGEPKERHYEHFLDWLSGKIGRQLVLGRAPSFQGVPSPPPGPAVGESELISENLVGDYNDDGTVDAADYVVWRDNLGAMIALPNDATPGLVTPEDYDIWRANFGNGFTATSARIYDTDGEVPEPSSYFLISFSLTSLICRCSNFKLLR